MENSHRIPTILPSLFVIGNVDSIYKLNFFKNSDDKSKKFRLLKSEITCKFIPLQKSKKKN